MTGPQRHDDHFSIGLTLGELTHRLTALEQKLTGYETNAKRIVIVILLGFSTAVPHLFPSAHAKFLLSAAQQLLSVFSP